MNNDEFSSEMIVHCLGITIPLVRFSKNIGLPVGNGSGFFIRNSDCVIIVSAGHVLAGKYWSIETTLYDADRNSVVCIPINAPWNIKKIDFCSCEIDDMDIAWAEIDFSDLEAEVKKNPALANENYEYIAYTGPLDDSPDPDETYAYASYNRTAISHTDGINMIERNYSFDVCMKFKGIRKSDGLYIFSVPDYKGDEYYKGASGSPIVDPEGRIVALLLSGCELKSELYGFPSIDLSLLIEASLGICQK